MNYKMVLFSLFLSYFSSQNCVLPFSKQLKAICVLTDMITAGQYPGIVFIRAELSKLGFDIGDIQALESTLIRLLNSESYSENYSFYRPNYRQNIAQALGDLAIIRAQLTQASAQTAAASGAAAILPPLVPSSYRPPTYFVPGPYMPPVAGSGSKKRARRSALPPPEASSAKKQ